MYVADLEIQEYAPLARMTTLGVGGPARHYLKARSPEAVAAGVAWAQERGLPLLILGGGSNMLISDDGYPGLVLRVAVRGIETHFSPGAVTILVGAGENWSTLVARAVFRDWAGVECLAGIPGLVGATPVQNVGAYGQEVRDTITHVEALDLTTGQIVTLDNAACGFGYRESRFKREDRGRFIILRVAYRLTPGGRPSLRYHELNALIAERGVTTPQLTDVREAVLRIRRQKSMLLDPRDPNARSVGSFFLNPIMSVETYAAFTEVASPYLRADEYIPAYPSGETAVKVPAAWLIERAGFTRGYTLGNVGLSSKHTLALVNRGAATACDVIVLAREIRNRVRDRFGVTLIPEPAFVGVSLDNDVLCK